MNNQPQKEWFFKIKPQEQREDPKDWCILSTENTIVALNIFPADFWHVIIFPKKQNVQDFTSKDEDWKYILSEEEKLDFLKTQESMKEKLLDILNNNPELIINIYKSWIENDSLMSKISWCKERLQEVMQNWNNFKQKDVKFSWIWNYFENRWPHSWRMISTYHTQFIPQFWKSDTIETSDALSYLLTWDRNSGFLKREEILSQKNWIIFEDEKFCAILDKNPSSFGHIAITWKDDNIKSIKDFSSEFSDNFFEFIEHV